MVSDLRSGLEFQLVGKKVDTYIVDEPLGKPGSVGGSIGIVYRVHVATQPKIIRAMKVYREELSSDSEFIRCFTNETESWRSIQETEHEGKISLENIVRVYETGVVGGTETRSDGCVYLVMEYMDDGTLGDLIMDYMDDENKFPDDLKIDLKEALRIFIEAAKGLNSAHLAQVIHRDVHANNILLHSKRQIVKIGDFGVSSLINSSLPYTRNSKHAIKCTAPEQDEGKAYPATDVYQLGATMLELLAGILQPKPGYETKFSRNPNIPDSLKSLIKGCLEWEPDNRPDLGRVVKELGAIRGGIIKREERYGTLIRESATALSQIGKKANSNKGKVLVASDVSQLYQRLRAGYAAMTKEGFDTPVQELELIINELLQRDLKIMMDFAQKYEPSEIQVVSPTVAEQAKIYRESAARWSEETGRKLLRVLPDYTLKVE